MDEARLGAEEVNPILVEATEETLAGHQFLYADISKWTKEIMDTCIRNLTALKKPYKYIVTCVIMQKKGAAFHEASSCYWDSANDLSFSYRWENKSMHCITSVFAISLQVGSES
jgi:dynein light chain Tctex-type 1